MKKYDVVALGSADGRSPFLNIEYQNLLPDGREVFCGNQDLLSAIG